MVCLRCCTLLTYFIEDDLITPQAAEDDIIPLSDPVRTRSGELVDSLTIAKGTLVAISMESTNRSAAIWGEDAKVFRPSRWLEGASGQNGIPARAKEVQGYRHLLTFVNGPRTCLGKNFAVTEFKVGTDPPRPCSLSLQRQTLTGFFWVGRADGACQDLCL